MINIIVATSKNNQIGINNQLPWHISEDLKYFRTITSGKTVLMGRKTFESIGRPLPNRKNIVLTRDSNFAPEGVSVVHSLDEALEICKTEEEIFIIGGGEIYSLFLPYADYLYITLVDKVINGDTDFPVYEDQFEMIQSKLGETLTEDGNSFAFTLWKRK
ncbi:dihydrofolate reductase [Cellulosilyticum ruminicola]|uniref:dihydrofolate reductase n=1 Tax=Cellulosilyticum ruminicola TaxID=425254 RepID=UPI0006D0D421|nr:dihydrofolate reductase [Cellulosilyticum ruminicola]